MIVTKEAEESQSDAFIRKGHWVYLRHSAQEDVDEFLQMVNKSTALHRPWVFPPNTREAFIAYMERSNSDRHFGCLVCHRQNGAIVGVLNLTEIVRGVFKSAYLGFYGFSPYIRKGLMKEGLVLLIRHAFRELRLHRIEANIQPENTRSLSLVRALGFRKEGFSPRYLKIGGRWRDHERWALLAESWSYKNGPRVTSSRSGRLRRALG